MIFTVDLNCILLSASRLKYFYRTSHIVSKLQISVQNSFITPQLFLPASKIKKLLLPFLVGVVLKFASVVPVILSIMGVLAMNALLAGKAALILTGFTGKITLALSATSPTE